MNINPLLKQAVLLSQESDYSFVLKHTSVTADMSQELMALVNNLVDKYRKPRQMEVNVKRWDDGRVYVNFTRDIYHPDDTVPMKRAKEAFVKEVKESRLLVPTN